MNDALIELRSSGAMPEPWLGDPASEQMRLHYNDIAIYGPRSGLDVLTAYQRELQRIADTLSQVARDYGTAETQIVIELKGGSLTAADSATAHGPLHAEGTFS